MKRFAITSGRKYRGRMKAGKEAANRRPSGSVLFAGCQVVSRRISIMRFSDKYVRARARETSIVVTFVVNIRRGIPRKIVRVLGESVAAALRRAVSPTFHLNWRTRSRARSAVSSAVSSSFPQFENTNSALGRCFFFALAQLDRVTLSDIESRSRSASLHEPRRVACKPRLSLPPPSRLFSQNLLIAA